MIKRCTRFSTDIGSNNYDWSSIGKDPATFTFGHAKQPTADSDGVAAAMNCSSLTTNESAQQVAKSNVFLDVCICLCHYLL